MKKRLYLAYGSNLNIEQMSKRCPGAVAVGTAVIRGYELLFKGSKTGSYLTIEKKKGGCVPVAVWEVTKNDEDALDHYEGYPIFYYKKQMDITYYDVYGKSKNAKAFVYIMDEKRELGVPHERYIRTCYTGYKDFGFDSNVLKDAIKKSVFGACGDECIAEYIIESSFSDMFKKVTGHDAKVIERLNKLYGVSLECVDNEKECRLFNMYYPSGYLWKRYITLGYAKEICMDNADALISLRNIVRKAG